MRLEGVNSAVRKQSELFEKIDVGLKKAVKKALLRHKQDGHSIHILVDNKIVEIIPEKINVNIDEVLPSLK